MKGNTMQPTSSSHVPGLVPKKTFILEGNIGAGKSTFLNIIAKMLDADVILEPTDKWQKVGTTGNLLDLFYKDTPRWAYTFQSYAFISRIETLQENDNLSSGKNIQFLERSIYCDRFCFAKNCYKSGFMTDLEWQIYKDWFAWLEEKYAKKPSGFIYLQADPTICYQRLTKRNRSEETAIPLSYLTDLHNMHEDWLIEKKDVHGTLRNIPVLTINGNTEFEKNEKRQNEIIEQILQFINQTNQAKPQKQVQQTL
ncbi:MAG: deoxynucleoside kinase [bacterium]